MATPTLQWSAAEVSGGVLTVPIDGDRPKGWKDKFAQVVTLLGGGDWDGIACKAGRVRVSGVTEGSEEKLRHFLEGVMQETNAALAIGDEDEEADGDEPDAGEDAGDDADARLTERFRNFAS